MSEVLTQKTITRSERPDGNLREDAGIFYAKPRKKLSITLG